MSSVVGGPSLVAVAVEPEIIARVELRKANPNLWAYYLRWFITLATRRP